MDVEHVKIIFDQLYKDINGYKISADARKSLGYYDKSHTYGEVVPESFYRMVQKTEPKKGEKFYDLGSGTGKAVILAHLLFDFYSSTGIEILEGLYDVSRGVLAHYNLEFRDQSDEEKQNEKIEIIHGDLLEEDFSDGDVLFTHCTCFYNELWIKLLRKFEFLRSGTRIITVTRMIDSPSFLLIHSGVYNLGWGKATVFCYRKA